MERVDCGLFHSPIFKCDASSGNIGHSTCKQPSNLPSTHSSCHSSSVLQISALFDYENPKLKYTYKSGHNKAAVIGKKDIHKFAERNRRKDMKTLFSLLRSLLPHEYIMGKCSTAEQLSETTDYIKHLQQRVKELTQKREEMRKEKIREDMHYSVVSETFPRVKVNFIGSGVLVSTSTIKSQIVQSDLLLTLENNGLDIISATSSAMNDKIFHTIHAKVSDMDKFESRTLYQKVWNLVDEKNPGAKPTQT